MKKVLSIVIALVMVFAFTACGEDKQARPDNQPSMVGVPSPMVDYTSLSELNSAYGFNMKQPGVMGVSDESFTAIEAQGCEPVAQYKFSVNGHEFTLRASTDLGDFSGIHVGQGTLFSSFDDGEEARVLDGDYYGSRWYTIDCQYCLTTSSDGMEADTFEAIADEMEAIMLPLSLEALPAIESVFGDYADSYGQRAVMTVSASENDTNAAHMIVSWGSSASETDVWEMDASFSPDGLLSYSNGTHQRLTLSDAEATEETVEDVASDLTGWFVYDAETGKLEWSGAPEADCASCVFELIAE